MTPTISRFEARIAPCGRQCRGEQTMTEDLHGLVTEEVVYSCRCRSTREEFHDGSVHRIVVHHNGKVLMDEEQRGE